MIGATATARQGLTPKALYRALAIAEAITWTLLLLAMVAKYGFHLDGLVPVAGPIHGFAFLAYGAMQLVVGHNQRWRLATLLVGILTAVIPFATVPWERSLARRGLLEGGWRTEAGDDPRDARRIDRAFRWGIRHALLMAVAIAVVVAIVFVVLLQAGPPSEWLG